MASRPSWWVEAFERLAEVIPARIVIVRRVADRDVVLDWVNPATAAVLGVDPEAAVGSSINDIYPPETAADVCRQLHAAAAAGRHDYETVRELPTGRTTVRVTVLPLDDDRFVLFGLEVSAEREATRRLEQVTALARIGTYQWNLRDQSVIWSPELYRILGYDPYQVPASAERWMSHIHPDDQRDLDHDFQLLLGESQLDLEFRLVRTDGSIRQVAVRSELCFDENGEPSYVLGTCQDVTEQRQLEREATDLRRRAGQRATAVTVHDGIVQAISTAWLALELDRRDDALAALERANTAAQRVVRDLFADVTEDTSPDPGSLRVLDPETSR